MALFGKKKKPKNRSENISFQIDNVSQRAKQLLFSLSMSLCTLGHCPIRWIWSTPPPWPTPHGGVGSGGGTRGISSLSFFPSQGLRLKGLKWKGKTDKGRHCQDEKAKLLCSRGWHASCLRQPKVIRININRSESGPPVTLGVYRQPVSERWCFLDTNLFLFPILLKWAIIFSHFQRKWWLERGLSVKSQMDL